MRFVVGIILVTLAVLVTAASGQFKFYEVKMPLLNDSYLELKKSEVDFLNLIDDKRVIWVVGEFKVGKTFIIDMLTNAANPRSDPIANTLGLNIYIGNSVAIVDSEGMNQPAGQNNPYFVKEFIMNLMELTADEVVLVSDQMKLTDIEVYRRIARMYYNTKMTNFFYIHNCKRLSIGQLGSYQSRVQELLSLDAEFVDTTVSIKPIGHMFYPSIPLVPLTQGDGDNLAVAILKSASRSFTGYLMKVFGGSTMSDLSVILTSNKFAKRKSFAAKSYAQAIDQSLRYMGIELKESGYGVDGKFRLKENRHYIVEYSPPWIVYCMADETTLVMKIRTGEFQSFARIENGRALSLHYMSYTPDYQRYVRDHKVFLPLTSLDNIQSAQPWRVFRHQDGITALSIPVPEGQGEEAGIPNCIQTDLGSEIMVSLAGEIPMIDSARILLRHVESWKYVNN